MPLAPGFTTYQGIIMPSREAREIKSLIGKIRRRSAAGKVFEAYGLERNLSKYEKQYSSVFHSREKHPPLYIGYSTSGGLAAMQVRDMRGEGCPLKENEWLPLIVTDLKHAQDRFHQVVVIRNSDDWERISNEWLGQGYRHCCCAVVAESKITMHDLNTGEQTGSTDQK